MLGPLFYLYAHLPPWLVGVFGLAFLALQILLMIDCLRNQRDFYWLWLLWVFPFFGALAYCFYYLFPNSRLEYWLFRRGADRNQLGQLEAATIHIGNASNFEEFGDALWRQKRYPEAEKAYREAVRKDPKLRDARARLGYCLTALGRPAEALPLIESVIAEKRDHDHEHLLWEAARCQRALGDLAKARQLYEEYTARHSYFAAQVELAEVCAQWGDVAEARRLCEEVMTDLKHSPPYVRRRQGRYAGQARSLLRKLPK